MGFYIGQLGAKIGKRHKPNGPFWTGQHWSKFEHRKIYSNEEAVAVDFDMAYKTAQNKIAVFSADGTVIRSLRPTRA